MGNDRSSHKLYFLGLQNHCRWWLQPWNSKTLASWKKSHHKHRQCIKKQRLCWQRSLSQSYAFSSSHVGVWELDHKEDWTLKNWCFWTVVLEKTLESPLDCKEIQPVHPKWNQSWIFIRRSDAEAETPILWPPDVKSWFIGKVPDAGEDWRQEEKGKTEDKIVGYHHLLNRHGFEQAPGDGEGLGSLACCSPGFAKSQTQLSDWTATKRQWKHPFLLKDYQVSRI